MNFFPDSSLERLDSSLHDSFSIGLPINDPTGETMTSRYKREESGYLPKQGKKLKFADHATPFLIKVLTFLSLTNLK